MPKSPAAPHRSLIGQKREDWARRLSLPTYAGAIQTRLAIGAVDDPLEAEADRVAGQVLRLPQPAESGAAAESWQPRGPAERSSGEPSSAGRPLDPATRAFFEPRFGYDFSQVRIHSGEQAAESARSIGALAYTAGAEIAFDRTLYQPGTGEGRRLLAHELTHVVQQGYAAPAPGSTPGSGSRVSVSAARATPSIQRDTPAGQGGQTSQVGPLSITKQFTPESDSASRAEVTQALTDFLYRAQAAQGGQTLHVTDSVRWAVRMLFQGDPIGSANAESFLAGTALPGSAPEFAAAVAGLLPDFIPRSRLAHLAAQSPKDTPGAGPKSVGEAAGHAVVDSTVAPIVRKLPISKSWQDKIIDGARGAVTDGLVGIVDQAMSGSPLDSKDKSAIHSAVEAALKQKAGTPMDRQQEGAGSPYAPMQPPSGASSIGSAKAPGEHIFNLPKIRWDFPTPAVPKPNLPQPPLASEAQAVDKIIQALDDNSLIPAAAKGTPDAANYASAKELARNLANLLAAAEK
ncbi:MAG TPA: DUF4157 domain-containing protein, partial [Acidobacteriaceae bacterium]|nr:DUF4157 domain-containing protein [Acidobacteriaceae bacterium]